MKKWVVTTGIVVVLLGAAISAHWWGPPLWASLGTGPERVQSLTGIVQVVFGLGALIAAIVVPIVLTRRQAAGAGAQQAPPPVSQAPALRSAPHQLPRPPDDFTGRKAHLRDLRAKVELGGVTISCLRGIGGVGKTALALKLAEEIAAGYPDGHVFLDLKGTTEPLTSAEALARVIEAFLPDEKPPDEEAALKARYQAVLHGKRALLLLDNAADANQVTPLIPPRTCLLLVTSRQHFVLPGLSTLRLDVLPPKDARELLLEICRRIGNQADRIADLCGRLPLALRAAASLLATTPDLKPEEYAARLADKRTRLKTIGAKGVDIGVEASFGLSYEALGEEAKGVFCRLSVFPAFFDAEAEEVVCEDEDHAVLSDLVRRSLVEFNAASDRYRLHDLVRLFAAAKLEDADRLAAEARHALHYEKVLRAADNAYKQGGESVMRGLAKFDLEWQNIKAGQEWAAARAETHETAARLACEYPDAGVYVLSLRRHPRERIGWLESALAFHREIGDRRGEGAVLGNLGSAYADLGETRRAIEYHEKALAIDREIGDRRGEGQDLGNLGNAYADLGETRRAIEYYEQALAIHREIVDRRGEGKDLCNLGNVYADLGETRRAIEYYEQALEIGREIGDRRGEGQDLGNLGLAYAALGETRRAIEYYEKALAIDREIGDRRSEGNALCNMADEYVKLGDVSKAVPMAETALKIFEQIEHPNAEKVRRALKEWRNET